MTKRWTVEVFVGEDGGRAFAEARLRTDDTHLSGTGQARLNPDGEEDIPELGDELAAARALTDLGHRLLLAAACDIQTVVGVAGDEDAALLRHARFGVLPTRARPEDWVEETDTDPPVHELEQSITVVQHPGRTYET